MVALRDHRKLERETQIGVNVENVEVWKQKMKVSACRDDGEVPEFYCNGKVCITENESFGAVCIQREVLKTVLHMLNNMRGDDINIHD